MRSGLAVEPGGTPSPAGSYQMAWMPSRCGAATSHSRLSPTIQVSAAATPSVRHGVPVGALLGLAEAVLALDLDVMEAPGEIEAIDLGALQLGRRRW